MYKAFDAVALPACTRHIRCTLCIYPSVLARIMVPSTVDTGTVDNELDIFDGSHHSVKVSHISLDSFDAWSPQFRWQLIFFQNFHRS